MRRRHDGRAQATPSHNPLVVRWIRPPMALPRIASHRPCADGGERSCLNSRSPDTAVRASPPTESVGREAKHVARQTSAGPQSSDAMHFFASLGELKLRDVGQGRHGVCLGELSHQPGPAGRSPPRSKRAAATLQEGCAKRPSPRSGRSGNPAPS